MKTFLNIRGTNGSGKSTLARRFFGEHDATVTLVDKEFDRMRTKDGITLASESVRIKVTGQVNPDTNTCVVGSYSTMAGGLDKVKYFTAQFAAIDAALALPDVDLVVAEGVLASTVFGSWAEHSKRLIKEGHHVVWAFMSTPVDVCVQRVFARNGGKPVKVDQIRDKHVQIDRVRQRALTVAGLTVLELPYEHEWETLELALSDA